MRTIYGVFGLVSVLAGCSGSSASVGGAPADDAGAVASGDAGAEPTDGGTTSTSGGGNYIIVLRAVQTPVAVDGATSGQTPIDQRIGFSGLQLKTATGDMLTVAELPSTLDVGYNDGDETTIATVKASTLAAGHYTIAEVPIAYVKFTVAGTYHQGTMGLPGNFGDTISMADGALIDGAAHDKGYWASTFSTTAGVQLGATSGENALVAQPATASGITLDTTKSPSKYVFPVDLTVDPTIDHDVKVVFTVNTYQDFRWQDGATTGFTNGTFDVYASGFETVTQLGANSIATTLE